MKSSSLKTVTKPTATVTRQLKDYLNSSRFQKQIVKAYERYEVLAEGGLRGLVVQLIQAKLRRIGEAAEGYCVTAEAFLPNERVRPDILVWKRNSPRFWIELKDTPEFIESSARRDWAKLRKHIEKYPSIKAGFLLYVARKGRDFPNIKPDMFTRRLRAVPIKLEDYMKEDFAEWNKEFKRRAFFRPEAQRRKVRTAACDQ